MGQEGQYLGPPEGGQGYDMRYKFDDPTRNEEKSDYSVAKKFNMVSNQGCTRILKNKDTV